MKQVPMLGFILLLHLTSIGQGIGCFDLDERTPIYSFFAEYTPNGEPTYTLEDSIEVDTEAGVVNYF